MEAASAALAGDELATQRVIKRFARELNAVLRAPYGEKGVRAARQARLYTLTDLKVLLEYAANNVVVGLPVLFCLRRDRFFWNEHEALEKAAVARDGRDGVDVDMIRHDL